MANKLTEAIKRLRAKHRLSERERIRRRFTLAEEDNEIFILCDNTAVARFVGKADVTMITKVMNRMRDCAISYHESYNG